MTGGGRIALPASRERWRVIEADTLDALPRLPGSSVLPVPGPWPLGNVISVGDVLIILGLLAVLHRACRAPQHVPHASLPAGRAEVN